MNESGEAVRGLVKSPVGISLAASPLAKSLANFMAAPPPRARPLTNPASYAGYPKIIMQVRKTENNQLRNIVQVGENINSGLNNKDMASQKSFSQCER